jgi:Protein O-mannosyl-transferase TMEM260-like
MATSSIASRPAASESKATGFEADYRPSYLAAGIAGAAIFLLYLFTLAPSTAMWDTSEYIAAAYTLGLPHPPGNPLFVLLGRVFSILPIASSVAVRINILAALCSAVSASMWFLVTERVLVSWFPQRWQRIAGGAIAVLIGGTAFTVWNQSVVNEKVYTVSLMGIAIVSWLMIRWSDEPDGWKADRILVLVAYLLGLGYANHMAGMLAGPAAALAVLVRRPLTRGLPGIEFLGILAIAYFVGDKVGGITGLVVALVIALVGFGVATMLLSPSGVWRRYKLMVAIVGAVILGLTPFATQPIRAAYNPPINEGEPTACRQGLKWSCTFTKGTYEAFMYNFNRGQYGKPPIDERQACPSNTQPPCGFADSYPAQVGMWWWYFRWQWLRDAHIEHAAWQNVLGAVFLVLGLFGGWVHFQRDRRSFWFFGSLMFSMTLALIYYLNFKYGASQDPELADTVQREVRDRDYFFLWSFSAWGVWAALGLVFMWESIASLFGTTDVRYNKSVVALPERRGLAIGSPVLALALVPLFTNWSTAPRRGQTYTRDFAHDLLNSVEPYGVLVTVGDNDTFPLWYAQEVEGIRKDVVVANTSLLNTDWYTRQLIRRPIWEYDEAKGPAVYRGKSWVKPTTPPLHMTLDQADSLPAYMTIDKPMLFRAGDCGKPDATGCISATLDPRQLPGDGAGHGVLQKADLFVLRMIADSYPQRPIYFSRTSGNYARELGLGDYTITQGLAAKVFIPPKASSSDTLLVQSDGWLDLPRTQALWSNVFLGPKAVIKANDWLDRPSVGIPYLYIATGMELGEALRSKGQTQQANQVQQTAMQVAKAVHLESLIAPQVSAPEQNPLLAPSGDSSKSTTLPAKPAPPTPRR